MSESNNTSTTSADDIDPNNGLTSSTNNEIDDNITIDAAQLHEQVLQQDETLDLDNDALDVEMDIEAFSDALDSAMQLSTIRDFIRFCVTQLRTYDVVIAQGTSDVFAEAAAIVLHTLMLDWSADDQILDCQLTQIEKADVLALLKQRIERREPLSYLINLAYFCGLPFYVDERVLIPRSPIAELIRQQFYPYFEVNQLAQPLDTKPSNANTSNDKTFFEHGLADKQLPQPRYILDLCTGSGCIAVALATRYPDAEVDAADIDQDALEVAWINVEHHERTWQINLIESDLFAKLPANEQYDLIATNPPYVDAASMAELPPEFLYEPEHALAAGQDGLDLVHRILHQAPNYLSADGLLVCEVGDSEWALRQAYPEIEFDWLTFALGGSGVFAIDKATLLQYNALFAEQVANLES